MFDRVERNRKKRLKKATPITRDQSRKLIKALSEIGLPYTVFFDFKDSADNEVICLLNDTFIVKDYFEGGNKEI